MADFRELPLPRLDALPLGAHRLLALTDEALFDAHGVRVAFTGQDGGLGESQYDRFLRESPVEGALPEESWSSIRDAVGAQRYPLVVPRQVHGTRICGVVGVDEIERARRDMLAGADAVQVGCPGVMALLHSADCLLFVVVSPTGAFAVGHAGWRGAVAHIASRAVRSLEQADACPASQYNVYFSPHICPECFEAGPEVVEQFRREYGEAPVFDERHVNLAESVRCDAVEAGIDPTRIADAGICTKCRSSEYHSYRATGGHCGRNVACAIRFPPS